MNVFKIIGILLIIFGAVDFAGPHLGFDLWASIGIQLPEIIWKYSPYIAIVAGLGVMKIVSDDDEASE